MFYFFVYRADSRDRLAHQMRQPYQDILSLFGKKSIE
jgi:hypothetical protein